MHEVYTPNAALRATFSQFQVLCNLRREEHVNGDRPRYSFDEIRRGLGTKLLALLKRRKLLIMTDDRLVPDVNLFNTIDFWIDGSEDPDVGVQSIEERTYYEPFFDRLQERLRGSYVPQARRLSTSCGLSAHDAWGIS